MRSRFRLRRWLLVLPGLVLLARPATVVAMEAEKREDIRRFLQITDSLHSVQQGVIDGLPQIIDQFKKSHPNIPESVLNDMKEVGIAEIKTAIPELEEPMIVIYDDNFTAAEIKDLLTFFRTAIGRKWAGQQLKIFEQSYAVSKVWGQRVGQRIAERVLQSAHQKGYEL